MDVYSRKYNSCLQGKASKGIKKFIDEKGLIQVSDPTQIEAIIDAVIAVNQKQLEQYRAGKTKLQGHFVGYEGQQFYVFCCLCHE